MQKKRNKSKLLIDLSLLANHPALKVKMEHQQTWKLSIPQKREPKPPPIYIYGVNNLKVMLHNLTMLPENKTYIVKALPNNKSCQTRQKHTEN
jgi:hypothetical protein